MKKRIVSLFLSAGLLASSVLTVNAETLYGGDGWKVTFTEKKKMESNFDIGDMTDAISGMQPGDDVIFKIALGSANKNKTNWYMTNEVLHSLEDRSQNKGIGGGSYTYKLTYTDKNNEETVLFDSDTVGGENVSEAGEGLHEATNALEEFIFLDTLTKGANGMITLRVALDGETQGNDYQNTLADLQMRFAVEMNRNNTPTNPTPTNPRRRHHSNPSDPTPSGTPVAAPEPGRGTSVVMTGDNARLTPLVMASCVSGALFLGFAFFGLMERRKEEEEVQHEAL